MLFIDTVLHDMMPLCSQSILLWGEKGRADPLMHFKWLPVRFQPLKN